MTICFFSAPPHVTATLFSMSMNPTPADPVPSSPARRNVELKAKLASLTTARDVARRLATEYVGLQHQVDTYFHVLNGRLKLREIQHATAQLVWYARPDQAHARTSHYYLLDVADASVARQLLTAALGVRQIVTKHREIFLYHNVRIHLDDVVGLGTFLEFEAVLSPDHSESEGHTQVAWLLEQFAISPDQILATSYCDLSTTGGGWSPVGR